MSVKVNLQVYSQRTDRDISEGRVPPTDCLEYLPWGTRSLKLKVDGNYKGELYVRPEPFDTQSDLIAGYGIGENGKDILVSWGGGWERGFQLDYRPGEEAYIFFNLTHGGERAQKSYQVVLVARHAETGAELGRLLVTLERPLDLPAALLKPHWQVVENGDRNLLLCSDDPALPTRAPLYLSRWWPGQNVEYVGGAPPQVRLLCRRNVGGGSSQVDVWVAPNANEPEIHLARIDGDIQFPLVDLEQIHAELYYMANHWALRIWFFWLDKGVADKINWDGLDDNERKVLIAWRQGQEIPDAERVDLVFDSEFNLRFLCSDLHWRELWAPYSGSLPLRVSIGAEKTPDVLIRGGQGVFAVAAARVKDYIPRPEKGFDPSREVMQRLSAQEGVEKGPGLLRHKHTPFFHGAEFDISLISNDVLKG